MTGSLEQVEGKTILRLKGSLDIAAAESLKNILLDAVASSSTIQVDLAATTYLDVTALQLFWAARQEAVARGGILTFDPVPPDAVRLLVKDAGFPELLSASADPASGEMR